MRANFARCCLFLVAFGGAAILARGSNLHQDSKSIPSDKTSAEVKDDAKPGDDKKFDVPYWDRSESFQVRAALAVVGAGNSLGVLGARMAISENVPTVQGWEFFFDKVFPINRTYLDAIRDGRLLPDMRAKEIRDLKVPDQGLYLAYLQALRRSHVATLEMFQNSAPPHENVKYTNLAADPRLYRGEIITVKGNLRAIREIDGPQLLENDGLFKIYQGWILNPAKGGPPFAVVFTQMPKDLKVSDSLNVEVTFHGYFLSNILIPADKARGNTQTDLITPWLIGKTLTVTDEKAPPAERATDATGSYMVAAYTFGVILAIGVLVGLLNLYFRRTDQRTQARLAELREKQQPFSLDENEGS